jgi:hypothetical protein
MMPEPLEAEFTEQPYEPSVAPPQGVTRADVLTQARLLAAECNGVAALVEGGVGTVRHEFLDAWRRWYGAWLGRYFALERLPFDIAATDAEIRQWQGRLRAWRAGLSSELGQSVAPSAPPAAAPVQVKKGWPWWAVALGLGGGGILLWKVGQWIFTPSYTSTGAVVADVAQTVDAVNDVRRR